MANIEIKLPGTVWNDALDPSATSMQAELGLPKPLVAKRGRGFSVVYRDVGPDMAKELAAYLEDRGYTLLANSDPTYDATERGWYRAMIKAAEKIEADLKKAKASARA